MSTIHRARTRTPRLWGLYPQDIVLGTCGALWTLLLVALLTFVTTQRGWRPHDLAGVLEVVVDAVLTVALFVRRVHPRTSYVVIVIGLTISAVLGWTGLGSPFSPSAVAAPLALVAVVGHVPDRRWGWSTLAASAFGAMICPWSGHTLRDGSFHWGNWAATALFLFLGMATFYLWASRRRAVRTARHRELDELAERNRLLQVEATHRLELARTGERNRIAREVHDIVAHNLAVVQVQAATGVAIGAHDHAAAMESLRTIKQVSKDALAEVRYLVGVLREGGDSDGGEWSPRAMVDQLPGLVESVRAGGLAVNTEGLGAEELQAASRTWPSSLQLACYRIVQESLTNVLKHGGPDARATVSVGVEPAGEGEVVDVRVANVGAAVGEAHGGGSGYGLQGLRERASALGGTLEAHPTTVGFEVRARLPLRRAS